MKLTKLSFIIFIIFVTNIQTKAQRDYSELISDGFNLSTSANYERNGWLPSSSYNLDYKTKGFEMFKFNAVLAHENTIIPDIKFKWETNLNSAPHEELLKAHSETSSIEEAYNKIMFVAGFGKRYIDEDRFDFKNPRSYFQLSYIKDTYFVAVSPEEDNLKYKSYNGEVRSFNKEDRLEQFTKFEEVRATFRSGYMILPYILQVMFTAGAAYEPVEVKGRFGAYYNTFNKPYSVTQAISAGSFNGDRNTIYDAKFKSLGFYEQYNWVGDSFYFNMGMNLGYSWLKLSDDEVFKDSSSPAFLYYATEMEMGWDIKLSDHFFINISGMFNYGMMYGITSTGSDDHNEEAPFEVSSLINNDLRYKINIGLIVNI